MFLSARFCISPRGKNQTPSNCRVSTFCVSHLRARVAQTLTLHSMADQATSPATLAEPSAQPTAPPTEPLAAPDVKKDDDSGDEDDEPVAADGATPAADKKKKKKKKKAKKPAPGI